MKGEGQRVKIHRRVMSRCDIDTIATKVSDLVLPFLFGPIAVASRPDGTPTALFQRLDVGELQMNVLFVEIIVLVIFIRKVEELRTGARDRHTILAAAAACFTPRIFIRCCCSNEIRKRLVARCGGGGVGGGGHEGGLDFVSGKDAAVRQG